MSFQRKRRHFTDISFPRGKHRPHLFCQQFLAVYAMLSHYLICGEFYVNHKEKMESIMLLRMDTALLIFLALYQHWWIKPPTVLVRQKHRVILFHSGKETEIGGQVRCPQLCGGKGQGQHQGENLACGVMRTTPSTLKPCTPPPCATFREQWSSSSGAPMSEAAWRMCFQVRYLSIDTHWFSLIISTEQTWFWRVYVIWKMYRLFVRHV